MRWTNYSTCFYEENRTKAQDTAAYAQIIGQIQRKN